MANSMYALGREGFLEASVGDALSITLKVSLVSTSYTPNLSTDQYYSSVSGGAIVAAGVTLTSVTGAAGTLSAANTTFSSVSGSAASYLVLYKDTGTASTSPLIGLIDTATGLPVTPNGGNITVAWASGAVFTLCEMLPDELAGMSLWARTRRAWLEICGVPYRVVLPVPRVIQHAPTPEQREKRERWLSDQRAADELERQIGHALPALG